MWDGVVTSRVEGWRMLDLHAGDAQLLHIDLAWASTLHAFQGRTVETADGCGRDAQLVQKGGRRVDAITAQSPVAIEAREIRGLRVVRLVLGGNSWSRTCLTGGRIFARSIRTAATT